MNFGHDEGNGSGCGCRSEMNLGFNSTEPVVSIVRCKIHGKTDSTLATRDSAF